MIMLYIIKKNNVLNSKTIEFKYYIEFEKESNVLFLDLGIKLYLTIVLK